MRRTTIFIDEALESDLRVLAKGQGRHVSSLVREAISEYVQKQRGSVGQELSFIAVGRSGRGDTAERHEELLWSDLPVDSSTVNRNPEKQSGRRPPKAGKKT